jgi:hypothetical protein
MIGIDTITERVPGKVYILMARGPSPYSDFIEVEDHTGVGIALGRWVMIGNCRTYALEIDDPRAGNLPKKQLGQ